LQNHGSIQAEELDLSSLYSLTIPITLKGACIRLTQANMFLFNQNQQIAGSHRREKERAGDEHAVSSVEEASRSSRRVQEGPH